MLLGIRGFVNLEGIKMKVMINVLIVVLALGLAFDAEAKKPKQSKDDYGVAAVAVQRGASPPTPWAVYSTEIGSPVGDTASGTFRFTCTTSQAPCRVFIGAAYLTKHKGEVAVYPRVLIQRQDYAGGGPQTYCEYGDAPLQVVPAQESTSTPDFTPLTIHIGGSADCGGPDPTAGEVTHITVPAGYYDVFSTFVFINN